MPLFTKHRSMLYDKQGQEITPEGFDVGETVNGFSNANRKPNSKALEFTVSVDASGKKRFTIKGLF